MISAQTRSWKNRILVTVLIVTAAIILLHWHQDLLGQNCEFCHVRHLPTVPGQLPVRVSLQIFVEWYPVESETFSEILFPSAVNTPRAPPAEPLI